MVVRRGGRNANLDHDRCITCSDYCHCDGVNGRNGDANYSKATKGNIKRLTMIYIILAVVLVVGLGVYIYFKG